MGPESGRIARWGGAAQNRGNPCMLLADKDNMRALSIRQPYAELILRGIKTCEYRSRPTKLLGERFWIYASKGRDVTISSDGERESKPVWSTDLGMPGDGLPNWMIELAEQVKLIGPDDILPRGVIVGSAVIARCDATDPWPLSPNPSPMYRWRLTDVRRECEHRKPTRHPQPVWFKPF